MTRPVLASDPALLSASPVPAPRVVDCRAGKATARSITPGQARSVAAAAGRSARTLADLDGADPFRVRVLPLFYETRADYLALARRVALELHRRLGRPVTVDDVRRVAPPKPPRGASEGERDWDGRVMGAIFASAEWRWVGFTRSERTTCHKRPISQFVPVNS